jgi:CRP-like cAMP-binding protein
MSRQHLIQFFTGSGLVDTQTAAAIAETFHSKEIKKNDFFLKEGKVSDQYFFLQKGFMRAFAIDPDGNDVTTGFYAPNSVVFEVDSFFNRTRSKENIQASTDCEGWFITYEQLNALFHSLPAFREFGRSILVRGYSSLKARMLSVITEPAEERYKQLLQTHPEIFQHAQLKHIASYLGITDTSLSRIRKELSKK